MNVSGLIFDNTQLLASIEHNVVLSEEDTINNKIIFQRFPIVTEIKNIQINSINLQEPKKAIIYV